MHTDDDRARSNTAAAESPRRRAATAALVSALLASPLPAPAEASAEAELAAARAVFEANLEAIENRDREAYLSCYLESEQLARTGFEGFQLGYQSLAAGAGSGWPDVFEGRDLRLVRVRPGVVYGTYRYRVAYDGDEHSGISERLFVETAHGWKIAVTTAFDATPGTPPPPLTLLGATLVDGSGRPPVADAAVVLRSGLIDCAGSRADCPVPEGVETIDLTGLWIAPGLIDAHVHFSQTGWVDGRPDALDVRGNHPYERVQAALRENPDRWFRSYLCSGVTAVFDNGGYPWTWGLRGRESSTLTPRLAVAGPLLSTLDFWLNLPAERQFIHLADPEAARAGVRYLAAHGSDAVKVWFITRAGPFEELATVVRAAGDEAARLELPLIVHATELDAAKVALRAGAHLLVHSVVDRPVDDEFLALAKERGTVYCPTLTVLEGYRRLYRSVLEQTAPPIDDPNSCLDAGIRELAMSSSKLDPSLVDRDSWPRRVESFESRARQAVENLARVHAAGIPVAMGTDAGNPLTFHGPSVYAEMEAMQRAGMGAMDVLVASTRGGALAMGRLDDLGTVAAGKAADLVILEADPAADAANLRRLWGVVRGGVLRRQGELRAR